MSERTDNDRFVKNPSLLVELCREVIDRLDTGGDDADVVAMETQLREISRVVGNLGRKGVTVPDVLRAEKTRLAAALAIQNETIPALNHLADELEKILKDLKARLGRGFEQTAAKRSRSKRSYSQKTDKSILRRLIIEALKHYGGSASKAEVLKYMEKLLQGKLLPGDMKWRDATHNHAWENNACWERYQMTQDGILKTGSARGVWELSEGHR